MWSDCSNAETVCTLHRSVEGSTLIKHYVAHISRKRLVKFLHFQITRLQKAKPGWCASACRLYNGLWFSCDVTEGDKSIADAVSTRRWLLCSLADSYVPCGLGLSLKFLSLVCEASIYQQHGHANSKRFNSSHERTWLIYVDSHGDQIRRWRWQALGRKS